jgi:2'-5' RNA ligase
MPDSDKKNWNTVVDSPVYIVCDIPSPMAEKIQAFRKKFDPERAALPAEITLTGSCGTGLVSPGQSVAEISAHLEQAAKHIPPFELRFDGVARFPETHIYFLTLQDSPEFLRAQKIVSECGIHFEPVAFPYHPHCTLDLRKEIQDEQTLFDLFFLEVPREPFLIDMISVYALTEGKNCEILCKIPLG